MPKGKVVIILIICLTLLLMVNRISGGATFSWTLSSEGLPAPKITSLACNPTNSQIMYALSEGCGLFKSNDGGKNWVSISYGLEGSDIFAIALDPAKPQFVYAAGYSVFKSDNGGNSWTILDLMLESKARCISVNPANGAVYIGTEEHGVFFSFDGGATWKKSDSGLKENEAGVAHSVQVILFDSMRAGVVYAGTSNGMYKSTNSGVDWKAVNAGLTQKVKLKCREDDETEVEVDVNPSVFATVLSGSDSQKISVGTNMGVFVTENGGETWSRIGSTHDLSVNVLCASKDLERIYAATNKGIYLSDDGGSTWQHIAESQFDGAVNTLVVEFSEPAKVIACTDKGVFKSLDGGASFSRADTGLVCVELNSISSSADCSMFLISANEHGLFISNNAGASWSAVRGVPLDVSILSAAVDPENSDRIVIGTTGGIYLSGNKGVTFERTATEIADKNVYSVAFLNSSVVLAGTSRGLVRSTDSGKNWTIVNLCTESDFGTAVTVIAVDRKNSRVYIGTNDAGVFKSDNNGETWSLSNNGFDQPYPAINCIVLDPANTQILYAGTEGAGLFKSENGGTSWQAISDTPSPWVKSIAVNSKDTKTVYAVFEPEGVFMSSNNGSTWSNVNANLTSRAVVCLYWGGEGLFACLKTGVFKLQYTFEINALVYNGGTISPSGKTAVNYGDSKTFTITPSYGYKISNVKVDGKSVGAVSSYTFTNITQDHTIEATFEKEKKETVIILQIGNKSFTVNGEIRTLDSPPVIKNNRTLLPIRAVVEALGGTVGWDATERKVTIALASTTIELWIGKSTAKVNGVNTPIDETNPKVVPEIINSRTMLPLRFITESLGCTVEWYGTTKTITIRYGG